jgi:hypothetical protein
MSIKWRPRTQSRGRTPLCLRQQGTADYDFRTYAVASFCVTTPHFACGSKVLTDLVVCGFSALRAEKPHTIENKVPLCRRLNAPTA